MADFDVDAARAAGHSDTEIAKIQAGIAAARAAGYSDNEIKAHLSGGGGTTTATPAATPADPGWSAGRVLNDLGHYPAMALQAAAQGVTGLVNFPAEAADTLNRFTAPVLPRVLTTPIRDLPALLRGENVTPDTSDLPRVPTPDFGSIAKPQNAAEAYGSAAVAGGAAALTGGAITRLPALLQAGGKELITEVPRLLRESGLLGAVPGVTVEAADRNLDLDKLDPGARIAVEATIGATAAIAAHRFAGGNPIESVASKLGDSLNADEAGQVAQAKVRDWRTSLGSKIEDLKAKAFGPTSEDVSGPTMFGKVPLAEATTDNTETMKTLGELTSQGGVYKDVFHAFVSDMPPRLKAMFESIAQRNNPIMEYSPQREVPSGVKSAGPVNEVPPQMTSGPMPSYGPTSPIRADTFQGLQTVPGPSDLGVGFHIPEPPTSPQYTTPQGTITGFKAPLQDTMDLRSAVGEWISNPKLMPKGVNEAQASALYKSLTADIGNTMGRYGADAEWADYNAKTSGLYHAGNLLSKIASDVNPTKDPVAGGRAVEALWGGMRKDSGEIANLRAQVPEAADEVSAAFLRNQPEKWAKLPRATQEALVPNPFDRLVLNSLSGKPPSPLLNIQHLAEIPSMGSVGYVAGRLAESYAHDASLGATAPPYALTAAAMALPPAARFLGKVVKNPRLLNVPITGGIAGTAVGASPDANPLLAPASSRQ